MFDKFFKVQTVLFFTEKQIFEGVYRTLSFNSSFTSIRQALDDTRFIFQFNLKYFDFSSHKEDLVSHHAFHEPSTLEILDLG